MTPRALLKVRLTALGRDSNKVTLVLTGLQRISAERTGEPGIVHALCRQRR